MNKIKSSSLTNLCSEDYAQQIADEQNSEIKAGDLDHKDNDLCNNNANHEDTFTFDPTCTNNRQSDILCDELTSIYSSNDDSTKAKRSQVSTKNEDFPIEQDTTIGQPTDKDPNTKTESSTFSFWKLKTRERLILVSINLTSFFTYVCLSLLAPFFPKEGRVRHVSNSISGWIFAVFPLVQILLSPVFGFLVPHLGIKPMYIGGMILLGGSTILFGVTAYIDTTNTNIVFIVICFLLRITMATGCCSLETACYALIGREFPNSFSTVVGMFEVFVGIGFMSGAGIGGLLYRIGGFQTPFFVIGGSVMIWVVISFLIIPADKACPKKAPKESSKVSLLSLLRSPKALINTLLLAVCGFSLFIFDPTLEPHLNAVFGLTPGVVSLLFVTSAFFYAVSSPVIGRICDHVQESSYRFIQIPGLSLSAVAALFMGPSEIIGLHDLIGDKLWLKWICIALMGIGQSLSMIPSFGVYFTVTRDLGFEQDLAMYGTVAGLWRSAYAVGEFTGPSSGGMLYQLRGFPLCCSVTAALLLFVLSLLVCSLLYEARCNKQRAKRQKETSNHIKSIENIYLDEKSPLVLGNSKTYLVNCYPQMPCKDSCENSK